MRRYKIKRYKPKRRFKRKKSIFKNRLFWDFILISALIFLISYFLFFSGIFKIKEIKVSVPEVVFKKEIESFLTKELGSNLFLANFQNLENEILEKYPEIKTTRLKKKFPKTLVLEIEKRKPVGTFCSEKGSDCFLIDKEGIIFGVSTSENLEKNLITIFSESKPKNLGDRVVSEEKMDQILKINDELEKKLQIDLEKFILKENKELNLRTKQGWEIYFPSTNDINFTLTKLHLLLEKEIPLVKREDLQYIDLRFSKVFYK